MKVIIVGGVAGGASAAARLRRLDETAEIILFERGDYISYANCGLPYYVGGVIEEKSALTLQTPQSFNRRFTIDVRVRSEVVAVDMQKKTVTVRKADTGEQYTEGYDKLILSPGAEPIRPPMEGADGKNVFTLRTIPDTFRIKEYLEAKRPKTAVVVGGGYIGVELAENLHEAGVSVTIVELADHLIAPLDYDMACEVHHHLRAHGVSVVLNKSVAKILPDAVTTSDGARIPADMVVLAVGVRPESALAAAAGIATNPRGAIIVDEFMQTSAPDVYAVGDAVEVTEYVSGAKRFIPLAGPANKQGRIVADNICGRRSTYKGTQGTAVLKVFDLTVATTGLNERDAKAARLDAEKVYTFPASHATYYPGASGMAVKLVFERKTGKVLGAQIIAAQGADKRIDVVASAIRAGMTVFDLPELELAYAPPYSSAKDPVNMAGYVAQNILDGLVKVFHWHDVAGLDPAKVTLLDVRTPFEYKNGTLEGFINIPLDDLRDRLGELDKSKPVYATCQVGLRGYLACRILSQNGFDCYNLSGGFRLYSSVMANG